MVAMLQRLDACSFFFNSKLIVCSFFALFLKIFWNRLSCHGSQFGSSISIQAVQFWPLRDNLWVHEGAGVLLCSLGDFPKQPHYLLLVYLRGSGGGQNGETAVDRPLAQRGSMSATAMFQQVALASVNECNGDVSTIGKALHGSESSMESLTLLPFISPAKFVVSIV